MFKSTKSGNKPLTESSKILFIGIFFFYGLIEIAVIPSMSSAALVQSSTKVDRFVAPTNLIAGETGAPIVNTSGSAEIALAMHLRKTGVKMYGAFWCGYCARQKERFGRQAFANIRYIECDPRGNNPNRQACTQAGVKGYPTWVFPNGQTFGGLASLSSLANASGYSGSRNFKN